MTPTVCNTVPYESSHYPGANRPPSPSNVSPSRAQQHQAAPRPHSSPMTGSLSLSTKPPSPASYLSISKTPQRHAEPPRSSLMKGSLSLNLKSSLPAMDIRLGSTSANYAALKPSPLSPKDPNVFFDDFSDSFDDDFDQIDNDCYVFGGDENISPRRRGNDVTCTAVFRAGGGNSQQLRTVKNTRAMEKRAVVRSPAASEGWGRLPSANRKRIIDEIYEDCGGKANTPPPPPAKRCSSTHSVHVATEGGQTRDREFGGNVWKNDWQVEDSVLSKPPKRSEHRANKSHGSCDFPNLSYYELERKDHEKNTKDDEPSLARKLALKSGSTESSLPPPRQTKKMTTSLSSYHGGEEQQQLSLAQNNVYSASASSTESLPKPSQCSFFTAGPTW